ncbi:MAG: rod shape-determining protein MreC [Ghiorsea sp.]
MRFGSDSRFKNAYIWWVLAFFTIVLLSFKYPVGQQLNLTLAPALHAIQAPIRWYQDISLWFVESSILQNKIIDSQDVIVKQRAASLQLDVLRLENKQLRSLLNITQIESYTWQVAKVVSRGLEIKSQRLMLQVKNTHADDVIVSHEGLVGLIDTSDETHAVVRTILDASVTVPVTMSNSNLVGLIRGEGEHVLVDFIPLTKAPQAGNILITSGAGGVFPSGIPVARVTEVKAIEGGVFADVTAEPVSAWKRDAWLAVAAKVQQQTKK